MKKAILFGNGLLAELLYGYLKNDSRYEVVAFCVDDKFRKESSFCELPVFSYTELTKENTKHKYAVLVAVGYGKVNRSREQIFDRLVKDGFSLDTYIHKTSSVYSLTNIGKGSIILPNATIEPAASIGENTIVCANSVIGHHSKVGNHAWVASGTVVGGSARVGNNSFLGLNATISNGVSVGSRNIIGTNVCQQKNTSHDEVYLSCSGEKHRFQSHDYADHFLK